MVTRTMRNLATDDTTLRYLDDDATKALVNRVARLEGHMRSIGRMVEEHRCADEKTGFRFRFSHSNST